MTQMAKIDTFSIPIADEKPSHKEAPLMPAATYALISGQGFADFCRQFLAIGPLLHFRGKIHGKRPAGFVTSPPSWKWKIRTALTGYIARYSKHRPE